MNCSSIFRVFLLAVGCLLGAYPAAALDMDSLGGLTVLMEVYTYSPETLQVSRKAVVSLGGALRGNRPEGDAWFVRPVKNPPQPFTRDEFQAMVEWLKQENVLGLVLDGHPEIGDKEITLLKSLKNLTFLSLEKTTITDQSLGTLGKLKALKSLNVKNTAVSAAKASHFSQAWSPPWLKAAPVEPSQPASFFLGAKPEDGMIRGRLPRDTYRVDYSLKLKTLDGKTVTLSKYKGKVMFLNFWTTWCGPCREELPSLETLYRGLKDYNIFFAYVAAQPAGEVRAFLAKNKLEVPVYIAEEKEFAAYTAEGFPQTVIVSKRGDWVVHRFGADKWDSQEVFEYLLKLMNE